MDNYIITLLIQKKEDNCKNINEVKLEVMDALHEEGTCSRKISDGRKKGTYFQTNYGTIGRKKI